MQAKVLALDYYPPHHARTPLTLQQAVRGIGQLGGFVGRHRDGEPGVKSLWCGWQCLQDMTVIW